MDNDEIIKMFNETFDKINEECKVETHPYFAFFNKATFFAVQGKNYFVSGTNIIVNPSFFVYKKKYKKHIKEMFELFEKTNVDSMPAFKTRNAAKRAVAYNRHHEHIVEKQEREVEMFGIKLIRLDSDKFYGSK